MKEIKGNSKNEFTDPKTSVNVEKDKQTKGKTMDNQQEQASPTRKELVNQVGKSLQYRLNRHYEQWQAGLPFKTALSDQSYKAKAIGLTVADLAQELEEAGFIKVYNIPSGARFVFSGDCPASLDEIQEFLHSQEAAKEANKTMKKANKE